MFNTLYHFHIPFFNSAPPKSCHHHRSQQPFYNCHPNSRRRSCHHQSVGMQLLIIQLMFTMLSLAKLENITIHEFYDVERNTLIPFRDTMNSSSNLHGNWTGPPCQNNNSRWIGITCSNSHITQLILESVNLTGTLPVGFLQNITFLTKLSFHNNNITGNLPSLTNLIHLKSIFLSGNQFSGSIPLDYIYFPSLTTLDLQENEIMGTIPRFDQDSLTSLNLSYNLLSGPIPDSKVLERFNRSSFDHNPGLCGRPLDIPCSVSPPPSPEEEKKPLKAWSIVLIASGIVLVPLFMILFVFCCYRRVAKKEAAETYQQYPNEGVDKKSQWSASTDDPGKTVDLEFIDKQKPVFVLDELLRSSAEVLGKGILGTTYKATLESGSIVAVKRVKEMNSLTRKEFEHQMRLLGKLRHDNLVEMISFYYSKEEKLVVHEFIRHGSLFELLHESRGIGRIPLNWTTRLQIMKDVAKGLTFLHQSLPSQKPPHGNLKSSNVLIDFTNERAARAKLTDFGYLPLVPSQKSKLAIGQCPDAKDGKKVTHKSDVYCLGMLLLEVITGKLSGDDNNNNNNNGNGDVSNWVRSVVSSDWSTDIFDLEILVEKEEHEDMLKIAELALECTDVSPERRPDMTQILTRLEEIQHPQM